MNAERVIECAFQNAEIFSVRSYRKLEKVNIALNALPVVESARRGCDEAAFVQSGQRQRKPNPFTRHLVVANLFGAILRYDKWSTETCERATVVI